MSRRRQSYRPYEPVPSNVVYLAHYGAARRRAGKQRMAVQRENDGSIPVWLSVFLGLLAGVVVALSLAYPGGLL